PYADGGDEQRPAHAESRVRPAQTLDGRIVRVDRTGHLPETGLTGRIDGELADGQIAPPEQAARPAQREQVAAHHHRQRTGNGHTGAASSGSDSEPPGTIIGKTLASCSITSSTSAGPGVEFACRNASVTSPACFT